MPTIWNVKLSDSVWDGEDEDDSEDEDEGEEE